MGYTVLKVTPLDNDRERNRVEVVGEFPTADEANDFADEQRRNETAKDCVYLVEAPPSAASDIL